MLAFQHIRGAGVEAAEGLEPGEFRVDLEVGHVLLLAVLALEGVRVLDPGQHPLAQALERAVVFLAQVDAVDLGEAGDHRQRRQGVVVVGQGPLLTLEFVGQVAVGVDLAGADLVFLDGPVEQVAAVGGHGGGHHRPGGPVGMVVGLVQGQVVPVADHLVGHLAEPGLDLLRLLLVSGQGMGVGELQPQVGRGHAAQGPFAHGLAGVVEVLGHQRVGLRPGTEPGEGAVQLLRATVAHELHDLLAGAALDLGDVRGAVMEGLLRLHVEGRPGLVRAFVLAAKLQGAGVGRRHRVAAVAVVAGLELVHRGVVALGRAQRRGGLGTAGDHRQAQQARYQ